jgi:hypothetical protein
MHRPIFFARATEAFSRSVKVFPRLRIPGSQAVGVAAGCSNHRSGRAPGRWKFPPEWTERCRVPAARPGGRTRHNRTYDSGITGSSLVHLPLVRDIPARVGPRRMTDSGISGKRPGAMTWRGLPIRVSTAKDAPARRCHSLAPRRANFTPVPPRRQAKGRFFRALTLSIEAK